MTPPSAGSALQPAPREMATAPRPGRFAEMDALQDRLRATLAELDDLKRRHS